MYHFLYKVSLLLSTSALNFHLSVILFFTLLSDVLVLSKVSFSRDCMRLLFVIIHLCNIRIYIYRLVYNTIKKMYIYSIWHCTRYMVCILVVNRSYPGVPNEMTYSSLTKSYIDSMYLLLKKKIQPHFTNNTWRQRYM